MNKIYSFFLLSALFIMGCKTAEKAYDKGDYSNAIELAIKTLQKNPSDGPAKAIAQNAYKQAVAERQDAIRHLSNSPAESRYEQIYTEYRQLQKLYDLMRPHASLMALVKPADYSEYINTYRDKAAEVYYRKGLARMDEKEKHSYRAAYTDFQKALRLKPDDAGIRRKAEESLKLATVHVVILPMNDFTGSGRYGGYNNGYGNYSGYGNQSFELRNFEDQIVRNLRFGTNTDFVKFYSEWDARSQDIEPDEILEMRLGRMEIGRPYDQQQSRNVSREVVVKETVYKPDSVVRQTARVHGQLLITRRTLVSEGDLYVTARDPKGRILWNDIFRGEHRWQVEFASFRGDERALGESERALINRNNSFNTPREDEILQQVLRQIESEMHYRIRNHYSRYY